MSELFGVLILTLAGGATIVALLATVALLLPNLSGRAGRALEKMPGRSFLLGSVNFLFFFVLAVVLSQVGEGIGGFFGGLFVLTALLITLVLLLLLLLGLTGLTVVLASRLGGDAPPTAGRLMRAGALLVAGALAPLAGWFLLLPLALLAGMGAAIIALLGWGRTLLGSGRRGPEGPRPST